MRLFVGMLVALAAVARGDMLLDHRTHPCPSEDFDNRLNHSSDTRVLQIVVIPRNDALLQGLWYPHLSVECGERDAVDNVASDDVTVSPGLLDLFVEVFALRLGALYLPHVKWEVVVDIPVEVGDSK